MSERERTAIEAAPTKQACDLGPVQFEAIAADGEAWVTQRELAEIFGCTKMNISIHVRQIVADGEGSAADVRQYFTETRGKKGSTRRVATNYYNSHMVIAIGLRVRSAVGRDFRCYVTDVICGRRPSPQLRQQLDQQVAAAPDDIMAKLWAQIHENGRRLDALLAQNDPTPDTVTATAVCVGSWEVVN